MMEAVAKGEHAATDRVGDADSMAAAFRGVAKETNALQPGMSVGRYVVIGELGRGAMGVVLRAFDPKLHREVALKVVRVISGESEARLVREARAMARLNHPNVVAVYDVIARDEGSSEQPTHDVVLAMEYVQGVTLGDWLEGATRTPVEIIDVFLQAGEGLAAAHAEGLMHRDFKPANVLVGQDGRTRVTDFGLARAPVQDTSTPTAPRSLFAPDVGEDTAVTRAGIVVGTPRYMAPEQHRGDALTPALDQYGFCVALWDALAGKPPFAAQTGADLVAAKLAGPPSWPGPATIPKPIVDALRRGLSPDPADRFGSLPPLLERLAPRTGSPWTIWAVATATAGLAGAIIWTGLNGAAPDELPCDGARAKIVDTWGPAARSRVERSLLDTGASFAAGVWANVGAQLDAYADGWSAMHTDACQATRSGEPSGAMLDLRVACLERLRQQLQATVDVFAAATSATAQRAPHLIATLPPLSSCANLEALQADVARPDPDEAEAVDEVRAALARAKALRAGGDYDQSLAAARQAEAGAQRLRYQPIMTEALVQLADGLQSTGKFEQAESTARRAVRRAALHDQRYELLAGARWLMFIVGYDLARPDEALLLRELVMGLAEGDARAESQALTTIGNVLRRAGRFAEAHEHYEEAMATQLEVFEEGDPRLWSLQHHLANSLSNLGRYDEAIDVHKAVIEMQQRELGEVHPQVAGSHNDLGSVYLALSDHARAEPVLRTALSIFTATVGPRHHNTVMCRGNVAIALAGQGKMAEAEAETRAVLALRIEILGAEHPETAESHGNLANLLLHQGRIEEAEAEFAVALDLIVTSLGPHHRNTGIVRRALADVLLRLDRLDEAEQQLVGAREAFVASVGAEHDSVALVHDSLARLKTARGDLPGALAEFDTTLSIRRTALGADHPHVALGLTARAQALVALERYDDAEADQLAAIAIWETARGKTDVNLVEPLVGLAKARAARGDQAGVTGPLERALRTADANPDASKEQALAASALAEHVSATDPARAKELAERAAVAKSATAVDL